MYLQYLHANECEIELIIVDRFNFHNFTTVHTFSITHTHLIMNVFMDSKQD